MPLLRGMKPVLALGFLFVMSMLFVENSRTDTHENKVMCTVSENLNSVDSSISPSDLIVAMVASSAGKARYTAMSLENHKKYSESHGFDFVVSDVQEQVREMKRKAHWAKVVLLQELIRKQKWKWIWFVDLDTLVMNQSMSVLDLIDDYHHLIISTDCDGLNSGSFLLRTSTWSLRFLHEVWDLGPMDGLQEQGAIQKLWNCNASVRALTKIVEPRFLNSYPVLSCVFNGNNTHFDGWYRPGYFLVHTAGMFPAKSPDKYEMLVHFSQGGANTDEALKTVYLNSSRSRKPPTKGNKPNPATATVWHQPQILVAMIATSGPNASSYTDMSLQNHRRYAEKHNYYFMTSDTSPDVAAAGRPPHWAKIIFLQQIIARENRSWPTADWIWLVDLDTLVMNDEIKLTDIVKKYAPTAEFDFIVSEDCNGLNTGSFLIRNSAWALSFLQSVWEEGPHDPFPGEQGAIIHLYQTMPKFRNKFVLVPQRVLNSRTEYSSCNVTASFKDNALYADGDFLVHVCGQSQMKDELMQVYYNKIY